MRKLAIGFGALASVGALILLCGCATGLPRKSPVNGTLFTSVLGHDNATENTVSAKTNKICATALLGDYAFGSAAVAGAAGADIKQVSIVDTDMFTILGLYTTHCTVVHDGGGGAAPAAAPAAPGAAPGTVPTGAAPAGVPTVAVPPGANPTAPAPPAGKTI